MKEFFLNFCKRANGGGYKWANNTRADQSLPTTAYRHFGSSPFSHLSHPTQVTKVRKWTTPRHFDGTGMTQRVNGDNASLHC